MQRFPKAERLSGKKNIEELHQTGKIIYSYPFKIYWIQVDSSDVKIKVVISVPKRIFKKAVDRNKLKRRIREAYRKNKTILHENIGDKKLFLLFLYTSKNMELYDVIEKKIIVAFQKLSESITALP
jgi:ribonuclease P protein component